MPKQLYKFNPSLATAEVLQKTLVGREVEVLRLLKKIDECARGTSLRHFLIIGPRGIGKTHLILLIYHTLKSDIDWNGQYRDLDRFWVPVRFDEEEYRITTLGEFFVRIAEELKKESPSLGEALLPASFKGSTLLAQADTDRLLGNLVQARDRLGRRFLLLVDNFHRILERFTDEERGRLRDILMSKDLFLVIGTAPTVFDQVTSYEEPFYNFFENVWLDELDAEEGAELFHRWWEQENRKDFQERSDELRPRINALIHLSGGNPRLILSLYSILTEANILEVEEAFIALLDELTPYFQSRMSELSPQQVKILDTMALMDGPASPTQIAREANLEVSKVSSQFKRLERSGYVRVLKQRGERKALYDVKERLFRLWRQMRVEAGRQYLNFLVTVVKIWYSEEGLGEQFRKVSSELLLALKQEREERAREALKHLWYIREASPPYLSTEVSSARVYGLIELHDFEAAEAEIQALLGEASRSQDRDMLAEGYWHKAYLCYETGDRQGEMEALTGHLELRPKSHQAWTLLGGAYSDLGRYEDALQAFEKAVEIKPDKHEAWNNMGTAYSDLGRYEDALQAFEKAVEIKPDMHEAWNNMGSAYGDLGRYEDALQAFDKAIEIKPDIHEAWYNMGNAYADLGRYEEAIEAFGKAIETKPDMHEAWNNMGNAYADLRRHQEAVEAYDRAIELAPVEPSYRLNRGGTLADMGKVAKALRDAEEAYRLAQQAGEDEFVKVAITRIVALNLYSSERRASQGKLELSEKYLRQSLPYAGLLASDDLQELVGSFLTALLRNRRTRTDFLSRALEIVEQAKLADLDEFLRFYRTALQYLDTGDRSVLNQLFPELRELIESLDQ